MPRVWYSMHALGEAGLPTTLDVAGRRYTLEKSVKHDFWAATGFYVSDPAERIVVKINRQGPFALLPLRWIGRRLARREIRAYAKLQHLPNIPRLLGPVTDTGFAHAYIDGAPLQKGNSVPDAFFGELMTLIDELHRAGLAYVDTNKPENILLGVDSKPYLIDFQIHVDQSRIWPRGVGRWILKRFYNGDVYHVLKNKRRFRPDQLTEAERIRVERRGFFVQLHRTLTKPYFWIRRPLVKWLNRSGRVMDTGSN
jgi:hypothetical protein